MFSTACPITARAQWLLHCPGLRVLSLASLPTAVASGHLTGIAVRNFREGVFVKHKFLIPLYMLIIRDFVRHTDPFHLFCLVVLSRVFLVTFWGAGRVGTGNSAQSHSLSQGTAPICS